MTFFRTGLQYLLPLLVGSAAYGIIWATLPPSPETSHFSEAPQNARWGEAYLPNLPVVDQDGNRFRFYDDLIKGRKVVVNFIFTSCSAICPLTMARMAQLYEKLGDIAGSDVRFYSITVDPEHDDPDALKRYAQAFKLDPKWRLLTGATADLQIIRDKLGERSRVASDHRHEMLIGNDLIGDWSKDSAYGDLDRVAINIRMMDPAWRMTSASEISVKPSDGSAMLALNDVPGEGLFIKACASCHSIGHGDSVGPDLMNVSARRDAVWLTKLISRPDLMLARNDDAAIQDLKQRYPMVVMPNLGLSEQDAGDVIAYIQRKSAATKVTALKPVR
jgi:protein SCO1